MNAFSRSPSCTSRSPSFLSVLAPTRISLRLLDPSYAYPCATLASSVIDRGAAPCAGAGVDAADEGWERCVLMSACAVKVRESQESRRGWRQHKRSTSGCGGAAGASVRLCTANNRTGLPHRYAHSLHVRTRALATILQTQIQKHPDTEITDIGTWDDNSLRHLDHDGVPAGLAFAPREPAPAVRRLPLRLRFRFDSPLATQSSQYHLPFGAADMPVHARWNYTRTSSVPGKVTGRGRLVRTHSRGHSSPSHATMSP